MKIDYQELILVRLGEITLKGLNRRRFEARLIQNMRYRLRDLGKFKIYQDQSRVYIEKRPQDEIEFPTREILKRIKEVFGYTSASPVRRFSNDKDLLYEQVKAYVAQLFSDGKRHTFKFETRRVDKKFPLNSYELNSDLGALVLERYPDQATVDVHQPELLIQIEIRKDIYLYHEIQPAYSGLPVGTSGKGMLLLSGGIDSPVAGFQMASRGLLLESIYFHTFPYTGDQVKQKVIDLATRISDFSGKMPLHIVDFTEIQLELNEYVPPEMMTIVMRRMMMRIADKLADQKKINCIITGESLGQVASQTVDALRATNIVVNRPVFRPLISNDKNDTINLAREIGTYETSILPYEDCCTVFVAKHPKINPSLADCEFAEQDLDIPDLVKQGLNNIETIII
ncbi:MAG: tRNA 4-thiouridine(8) synthase ThiI [Clostridiaceae bacterium]|jgi:thiamine biosynthesis protein ThiI|nr:tRNA uracil 4-sulfurtransferase ThiI [Bacillota bacterium]NLN52176.1 tRNA 4-thiouridine(8) synthase ThiI [Clostridiaceae bacterium]